MNVKISPDRKSIIAELDPREPGTWQKEEIIQKCPNGYRKISGTSWRIEPTLMNMNTLSDIPEIEEKIFDICRELVPGFFTRPNPDRFKSESPSFFYNTKPLKHQEWLTDFLINFTGKGYLVCGGLGTGKTLTMIYLIQNGFWPGKSILVIAPNKVLPVWTEEFREHAGINVTLKLSKDNKSKRKKKIEQSRIYVTNYEIIHHDKELLLAKKFDVVILDESHTIRNHDTAMYKSILPICEQAEFVYCLTGTPRANSDRDLFTQLRLCNPYIFGFNYLPFQSFWFHQVGGFDMPVKAKKGIHIDVVLPGKTPGKEIKLGFHRMLGHADMESNYRTATDTTRIQIDSWRNENPEKLKKFLEIIQRDNGLEIIESTIERGRRLKKNTGAWKVKPELRDQFEACVRAASVYIPENVLDLPPLTFLQRYVEMPKGTRAIYDEIKEKLILAVESGITDLKTAIKRDGKLGQLPGGCVYGDRKEIVHQDSFKADLLADIILNEMGPKESCIVWFHYIHNIELASAILKKNGIPHVMVHGEIKDVKEKVEKFKSDSKIRVILTTSILKEGQTLNKATITIFYDHWYSYIGRKQAQFRNYRIGQENPVIVIDLIARDTIEEKIVNILRDKEAGLMKILNAIKVTGGEDIQDIDNLMEMEKKDDDNVDGSVLDHITIDDI